MSKWPRLSQTLPGATDANTCQKCAAKDDVRLWQEHDDNDQPEPIAIALCRQCEKCINPHPRLYARIDAGQPFPGAMPTCDTCAHRAGLVCKSPLLKANGGPGLPLSYARPSEAFACNRGKGCQRMKIYHGPVECKGKSEVTA